MTMLVTEGVIAYSGGAPDSFTGAPGQGNCQTCHTNGSGDGALHIMLPASYLLSQTLTVTVELEDPGQWQWGFELTALDASGVKAGSFTITDPTHTQLSTNPPSFPDYVKQTSAGTYNGTADGPVTWEFLWNAPEDPAGPVTFYAAANASQNIGSPSGFNYVAQTTIAPRVAEVPAMSSAGLALLTALMIAVGILFVNYKVQPK